MSSPSASSAVGGISKQEGWFAAVALGAALVLRVLYARHFRIDSDETQHLHVVWGWTQGFLPYRDFFDNHTPVFQALCAPLFHVLGVRADILAPMRLAMIPLFALTIACVWKIAASFCAPRIALWTAVLTACLPSFFLWSVEFRPDELWALMWLIELAVFSGGPLSPRRMFFAGVVLGLSFCVSMKTSLFAAALVLAFGGAIWMRRRMGGPRESPGFMARCGGAFLAGVAVFPALVVAYFVAHGAGRQMYYCVIQHNVLSEGHGALAKLKSVLHWLRWFPAIALGGWVIALRPMPGSICLRQTLNSLAAAFRDGDGTLAKLKAVWRWLPAIGQRPMPAEIRVRQAFVFFAAAFYYVTLVSFWPIITAEDYLPFFPAIMISAAPAALWLADWISRRLRASGAALPALLVAVEFGVIAFIQPPLIDQTADKTRMIADVLKLTDPGDFVMDSKGETIYRRRPFYYVLEGLTLRRLKRGLLEDDVPRRLIETRAPIVTLRRMPLNGKEFIRANYVPIAYRLLTLGKIVCESSRNGVAPARFEVVIPARYTLLTADGRAAGTLDGTPFDGPRELAAGPHEFLPAGTHGRTTLVWAQAVERGCSPFDPIKKDVTTEQD